MKSLLKIYGKYIGFTWAVILLLGVVNIGLAFWVIISQWVKNEPVFPNRFSDIAEITLETGRQGEIGITQQGESYLREKGYVFLLVLNDEGDVVYGWNTPEGFKDHYTSGEIAAFSRWYLHDYPVKVWRYGEGLLVAGSEKDSTWKYQVEFSQDFMYNLGRYARIALSCNLLIILGVVGFLGYRYYQSLRPLAEGIHKMASGQKVYLDEKGDASKLACEINRTSVILESQRAALDKRDLARAEWIAGISHDIRTPLSVIIGYADEFESDGNLSGQERGRAAAIRSQSLKIRQLIEDLNLTSKLEYQMQPLRISAFYPAALLRRLAAETMNEGLGEQYKLDIDLREGFEGVILKGDEELIGRAVGNLLGNSIRHNPGGCRIWLSGSRQGNLCVIEVKDDGCGIPDAVAAYLCGGREPSEESGERSMQSEEPVYAESDGRGGTKEKPHIMGLRIARQIVQAHKGGFLITDRGHCVSLSFEIIS